jgi:hypothetical protein
MFEGAASFNQPLRFDTTRVTIMLDMFRGASSLRGPIDFSDTPISRATLRLYGEMLDAALEE